MGVAAKIFPGLLTRKKSSPRGITEFAITPIQGDFIRPSFTEAANAVAKFMVPDITKNVRHPARDETGWCSVGAARRSSRATGSTLYKFAFADD
jgi:hypothetical protein